MAWREVSPAIRQGAWATLDRQPVRGRVLVEGQVRDQDHQSLAVPSQALGQCLVSLVLPQWEERPWA